VVEWKSEAGEEMPGAGIEGVGSWGNWWFRRRHNWRRPTSPRSAGWALEMGGVDGSKAAAAPVATVEPPAAVHRSSPAGRGSRGVHGRNPGMVRRRPAAVLSCIPSCPTRASPIVCQILLGESCVLPTCKKVCQVKKKFISNSLA
jgi:hypothetical protein